MKNGDKPAFSVLHSIDGNWVKEPIEEYRGLTKREYFAAMAMQSLMVGWGPGHQEHVCKHAVIYADELLKQLEQ